MAGASSVVGSEPVAGAQQAQQAPNAEQRALPNNALSRFKFFSLHTVVGLERLSIVSARARPSLACEERAEQVGDATRAMHGHVQCSKSTAQLLCA